MVTQGRQRLTIIKNFGGMVIMETPQIESKKIDITRHNLFELVALKFEKLDQKIAELDAELEKNSAEKLSSETKDELKGLLRESVKEAFRRAAEAQNKRSNRIFKAGIAGNILTAYGAGSFALGSAIATAIAVPTAPIAGAIAGLAIITVPPVAPIIIGAFALSNFAMIAGLVGADEPGVNGLYNRQFFAKDAIPGKTEAEKIFISYDVNPEARGNKRVFNRASSEADLLIDQMIEAHRPKAKADSPAAAMPASG
jgi:hypothetical protein